VHLRNGPLLITRAKGAANAFGLIEYSDVYVCIIPGRGRQIGPACPRRFFAGGEWAVIGSHGTASLRPH